MIKAFKNDYSRTCHPDILEDLAATNDTHHVGYGRDEISSHAAGLLRNLCACPHAEVHFIAGGTLTNLASLSAFLRPHQAIIAADSGHIAIHETGAIEATGHKILTTASTDGKLTPEHILFLYEEHNNEHMVQVKLVYISQSTELGTVYTKSELAAIADICKKLDLYLFVDGARLGASMTCMEDTPSLEDIAKLCDAFYIGGTKNGALFGEALILVHKNIQNDFRYLCKQRGALLAKGWLISKQFETLFTNNLYYELAKNSNIMAQHIDAELCKMGISLLVPTYTNQVFPILPVQAVNKLAEIYAFETWSKHGKEKVIRFVTSWNTSLEDVHGLIQAVKTALT